MARAKLPILGLLAAFAGVSVAAYGADTPAEPLKLSIKDHRFVPDKLTAKAGGRVRIEVTNLDTTPEEFESSDLKIEKFVVGGGKITVTTIPLKPQVYNFFGDYHPDTAKGTLTVTP